MRLTIFALLATVSVLVIVALVPPALLVEVQPPRGRAARDGAAQIVVVSSTTINGEARARTTFTYRRK